ncbi:translation initiation factor IF-2 [Flexibacter flexilis DSM 6793]|uniref:Translation initiation factor IF-2 n=1 Tax=Flexibacter flexilis DSM 6793 TaxID=927664 RepID=A0A1I1E5Z6_9BACT|nr:translation initiation factor IF-2 [Flexibacter flexilis]SFB82581.1 translation initiation factor IF-2 [Flexibacter flexilis DSM 6793]
MAEEKMKRISQVTAELNVGIPTIAEFLAKKGITIESSPNAKISEQQYELLRKEFAASAQVKKEASGLNIGKKTAENIVIEADSKKGKKSREDEKEEEIMIKNYTSDNKPKAAEPKKEETKNTDSETIKATAPKTGGLKVLGKIDLDAVQGSGKPAAEQTKSKPAPQPPQQPKQEKPVQAAPAKPVAAPSQPTSNAAPAAPTNSKPNTPPAAPAAPAKPVVKPAEPVTTPQAPEPPKSVAPVTPAEGEFIGSKAETLKGLTVLGKIELPTEKKRPAAPNAKFGGNAASDDDDKKKKKRKRKRLKVGSSDGSVPAAGTGNDRPIQLANNNRNNNNQHGNNNNSNSERPKVAANGQGGGGQQDRRPRPQGQGGGQGQNNTQGGNKNKPNNKRQPEPRREEISDKDVQEQIKATLAKLSGNKNNSMAINKARRKKDRRSADAAAAEERYLQDQIEAKTLRVTEFISASDLSSLMDVSINEVISTCMSLGMFVSINQRLDAEAITVIADEFGYDVQFISAEEEVTQAEDVFEDAPEDLEWRAPIVTIMGHVDHGKTSLLDYIRKSKVTAQEAGGITQHIGAYDVKTDSGKRITFLDTPGHEAFTAMRARGAKITDVAIIVVAADDSVMPQTREAINHAQVAGVPIVFAFSKVDKPGADTDKIRNELAQMNILVEDWGGKYQSQEISSKSGMGVSDLLEKVLLEAEMLDLKANPKRAAQGTVIEASLDKGRGYVTTLLVQTGTLRIGDVLLAGSHYGKVKAMTDHRGARLKAAGPSTPVQVLGLDGAPQAGDKFSVMESEREAREIANKREQLVREQSIRTKKHITLDEIGRRLAIGTFKELNVIVKGDVDGSIEALSDALQKLGTDEVQVRIIHKAVGQISESDVLLASASDAIIVGFQVRPSVNARKLADQEQIEMRMYSVIYDAINDVKDAMEGMLAPKVEEVITGVVEIRDVFKISKVGNVAGCYVQEGNIKRNHKVRLIRDGIVLHTGEIDALKRFKDDVGEVKFGYECGMSFKNYNDMKPGDTIEAFELKEVKRTL